MELQFNNFITNGIIVNDTVNYLLQQRK